MTARGICWDTLHNPTISNSHTIDGSGIGMFTSYMTGLKPNTTYYVRAYATNSEGTAYGNEVTFTTIANIKRAVFSVSATDSVEFSPGNLQWRCHQRRQYSHHPCGGRQRHSGRYMAFCP